MNGTRMKGQWKLDDRTKKSIVNRNDQKKMKMRERELNLGLLKQVELLRGGSRPPIYGMRMHQHISKWRIHPSWITIPLIRLLGEKLFIEFFVNEMPIVYHSYSGRYATVCWIIAVTVKCSFWKLRFQCTSDNQCGTFSKFFSCRSFNSLPTSINSINSFHLNSLFWVDGSFDCWL